MSGQAEQAPESGDLSDLASFLADTPDEESTEQDEEQQADESTGEEAGTDEDANDEQDAEEGEETEGEEPEDEPAPVDKITFKVKGEDGSEETVETTIEEVAKSYMRQQDYTRKTQALAERENQAVELLTQKHEEIRNQYLLQYEVTRAAVVSLAGIKSEAEMAQLAHTDPAAWVAESQRQQQIHNFLNQLNQQIEGEKQAAKLQQEQLEAQRQQQQFQAAWQELSKHGIDRPKLEKIYSEISSKYRVTNEDLSQVWKPEAVLIMQDALAYRALKEKKPEVMKKVQSAPRLPARQQAPKQERLDKALENKFKSGRAKLNDLAAYLR